MLLIKLYPNKNKKTKQKPWIRKSIIKSIKTKNIYYKKFLKTQSKFWYDRCRLWYIYQINNQKQKQLFKKLLSTKLLKDESNLKISFWMKMEYLTIEPSQNNSMIILLTMLKSFLKSWVKKITNSKTTLKIQTNTTCSWRKLTSKKLINT